MSDDVTVTLPRKVVVGEEEVTVARFRGLKGIIATALVSRVMRELPEIQERLGEYVKSYREKNTVEITPAMAALPRFAVLGLTSDDFAAAGGAVSLPDEPTGQQIFIAMMPDMMDLARREFTRLLALVAISNQELERADDADDVDAALDARGKQLMRSGDIDELLELGVVGWEVIEDQLMSKADRLGKLKGIAPLRAWLSTREEMTPEPEPESISPTSPEDAPTSSTDSEPPIDGTDEPLSTESLGVS